MSQTVLGVIVLIVGIILVVLHFDKDWNWLDDIDIYNLGMYIGGPILIILGLLLILNTISI